MNKLQTVACSYLGLQGGDQTRLQAVDLSRVGEDLDNLDNVHIHPVVIEDSEGALHVRKLDVVRCDGDVFRWLDQEDEELVVGARGPGQLLLPQR